MEEVDLRDLESLFSQVEDPRVERTKYHRLRDIIIIDAIYQAVKKGRSVKIKYS